MRKYDVEIETGLHVKGRGAMGRITTYDESGKIVKQQFAWI